MLESLRISTPFMASGKTAVDSGFGQVAPRAWLWFGKSPRVIRIAAIVAPALALWLLLFVVLPTDLPFKNDQNAYLGGAEALRAGHGYRFEQYIGLPQIGVYPPGYSLWLALFWKAGQPISANSYRLEVANWVAGVAALCGLTACLCVSELPTGVCSLILMLLVTSVTFTQLTIWLFPDVWFAAGSYGLALLVANYVPDANLSRWWFSAGLLALALCAVKAVAIAYIVGLAAYGLLRGDLRRLHRFAYFALPGFAVLLWVILRKGIPTDITIVQIPAFGGWGPFLANMLKLAGVYSSGRWLVGVLLSAVDVLSASHVLRRFSFISEVSVFLLGLAVFVLPIVAGVRKSWRRPKEQLTLFILAPYILLLILWPYYDGARFGIPLIPFLVNLLWRGLSWGGARAVVVVVLVLNVPGNVWLSYKILCDQEQQAPRDLTELKQAAAWINRPESKDARVTGARDVPLSHLYEYLGRRLLANAGPSTASNYVDVYPAAQGDQWADYLVIDESVYPPGVAARVYRLQERFGRWTVMSPRR